jgi:hypothetical protein
MTPITKDLSGRSICDCPAAPVANIYGDPIEKPGCNPIYQGAWSEEATFIHESPADTLRVLVCETAKVFKKQRPGRCVCASVEQQDARGHSGMDTKPSVEGRDRQVYRT